MAKMTMEEILKKDAGMPANCFTVGRNGFSEGIEINLDTGPNLDRPWMPHVKAGKTRIHLARHYGAIYHPRKEGNPLVRRATLEKVGRGDRFPSLVMPGVSEVQNLILSVDLTLPHVQLVTVNGHQLHIACGVEGGKIIGCAEKRGLVSLPEGEEITLFFPDGLVRSYYNSEGRLEEDELDPMDMAMRRIDYAVKELNLASSDGEIRFILSGMADLFNLPTASERRVRALLVRDFFNQLADEHLNMVHRKLWAVLHAVDVDLVSMVRKDHRDDVAVPASESPSHRKGPTAERLARLAAKSAQDASKRAEMKGASGGGKKNHTSNPDKAAKRARKRAQMK